MKITRLLLSLALAACGLTPALATAQSLPILPRSTAIAGLNDSALTLISDSAGKSRAGTTHELFKRPAGSVGHPSFAFALDSTTGLYRFGKDTLGIATGGVASLGIRGGAAVTLFGGAGNMTIQAGTGASRTITLQATNGSSAAVNVFSASSGTTTISANGAAMLTGSNTQTQLAGNGTNFLNYDVSADSLRLNNVGLSVAGGATTRLTGGAGSMTIQAGTGNSRTLTLKTTTSAGTAKNTLVLGADSSVTALGKIISGDTISIGGAAGAITGAQEIHASTSANSKSINLYASGSTGFQQTVLTLGPSAATDTFQVTAQPNGSAKRPVYTFGSSAQMGLYRFGADTLGVATGGVASLGIRGGASPTIFGGAGDMTIQAGTGNSRTLTLKSSNSSGTATTFLTGAGDTTKVAGRLWLTGSALLNFAGGSGTVQNVVTLSSAAASGDLLDVNASGGGNGFQVHSTSLQVGSGSAAVPWYSFVADTLVGLYLKGSAGASDTLGVAVNGVSQMKVGAAGVLLLPNLPAEGSTKNAMCWDGTTFNVTQNAAATCTVSARRFKENIQALNLLDAQRIVTMLKPSTYNEKVGKTPHIGLIAEEADSVDSRLATRNAKGQVNSVNYEEVTIALLRVVQAQSKAIDSLRAALAKPTKTPGEPNDLSRPRRTRPAPGRDSTNLQRMHQ